MSTPNMVADDRDMAMYPKFNKETPREWATDLEIYLMTRKRLHLGLKARPVDLALNRSAEDKKTRLADQEKWDERNDSVYGIVMTLAKSAGSDVSESAMNHHRDLEAQDDGTRVAKVLVDFLVTRFEGKTQSAIERSTAEYIAFMVVIGEKVEAAIDRLDCIIQRLKALGQEPTPASKVERLKAGLKIKSLKLLVFNIAMMPANTTYVQLCEQCRKYDDAAVDALFTDEGKTEINFTDEDGEVVTCGYPKCRKKGHTQEFCRLKKRHQKMSAVKRGNKNGKNSGGKPDDSTYDSDLRQLPGSKAYKGCHKCGSKDHLASDCKKRKSEKDDSDKGKKDWRDYTDDNSDDGKKKK
jgi:hypothetical protein